MISTRISTVGITAQNLKPLVDQCTSIQQFTQNLEVDLRDASGQSFDGEISSLSKWLKSGGSIALKTAADSPGLVVSSNEADLQPQVSLGNEKPFVESLRWGRDGHEALIIWSIKDTKISLDQQSGFDLSRNSTVYELHHTPASKYAQETYIIKIKQDVASSSAKEVLGVSKMLKRSEDEEGFESVSVGWQYSHGLANGKRDSSGMTAYTTQQVEGSRNLFQQSFQWTDKDGQPRICDGYRDDAGQLFYELESDSEPTPELNSSDLAQLADQLQLAEERMRSLGDSFSARAR